MGLKERRAIQEFAAKVTPEWQLKVSGVIPNHALKLELDATSLSVNGIDDYGLWEDVFIKPFVMVLEKISQNEKDAENFKKKFTTVVLQNLGGNFFGENSIRFVEDKIVLDHELHHVENIEERVKDWKRLIEEKL